MGEPGSIPPCPACPRAEALQWARLTPDQLCRCCRARRSLLPLGPGNVSCRLRQSHSPHQPQSRAACTLGHHTVPEAAKSFPAPSRQELALGGACQRVHLSRLQGDIRRCARSSEPRRKGFFLVTMGRGGQARAPRGNPRLLSVPSVQLWQLRLHQDRGQRLPRGPDCWQGPHGRRR